MDTMGILLEIYNIEDPVKNNEIGGFTCPELQRLFDELVAAGPESLTAVFAVGATIGDLNIYDLGRLIIATDNGDIEIVYDNLLKDSRNHMRVFYSQLTRNRADYNAQYLIFLICFTSVFPSLLLFRMNSSISIVTIEALIMYKYITPSILYSIL